MAAPPTHADLEIRILEQQGAKGYPVEFTLNRDREFPRGYLDPDAQPRLAGVDPVADGECLFRWLLADPALASAWAEVRIKCPSRRIRLRIDATAPELHIIPWELLRNPGDERRAAVELAAADVTPLSRYLAGAWEPGSPVVTRLVKMLMVIANPVDLSEHRRQSVDLRIHSQTGLTIRRSGAGC